MLSVILVAGSFLLRRRMEESPEFSELKAQGKTSKNPLKESFTNWKNLKWVLIALFGATAGQGVVWYTGQFYAMTFCTKTLSLDATQFQQMMLVVLCIGTPLFIFFGWLSDRVGRKWIMLTGIALGAVFYVPIYKAIAAQADEQQWQSRASSAPHQEFGVDAHGERTLNTTYYYEGGGEVTIVQYNMEAEGGWIEGSRKVHLPQQQLFIVALLIFVQIVFVTMAYGPIAAFLVELFPANIRYTSMSLPYHIGNGVFGGLTPLIAESLVVKTGNILAGVYYPVVIATITVIVGVLAIRDKQRKVQ